MKFMVSAFVRIFAALLAAAAPALGLLQKAPAASRRRSDPRRIVHVMALDGGWNSAGQHMQKMLYQWLLQGETDLMGSDASSISLRQEFSSDATKEGVSRAFEIASNISSGTFLWLLNFKDGDFNDILPQLGNGFSSFAASNARHGVIHWSPEFCDEAGATPDKISQAYRSVDFVFMFGHQDERLAQLNSSKYLPFPLGPGYSRGWSAPSYVPPFAERPTIASFRGSTDTHSEPSFEEAMLALDPSLRKETIIEYSGNWAYNVSQGDVNRYLYLMQTSKYALSPWGHNPNCYRIVEAVESGAVPVLVSPGPPSCYQNWASLYGFPVSNGTSYDWIPQAPFLVLEHWSEIGDKLRASSARARKVDMEVVLSDWYSKWRSAFREKFVQVVS